HPEVSAWCSLLICAYPVLEVIFSMLRRRRRHQPLADPDRLHMHSVLLRHVAHRLLPARSHNTHNSVTGALMWALSVPPSLWAVFNFDSTPALALGLAVFAVAYQVLYLRLLQFRRGREQWTPSQRSRHASGHSAGQG
ncbi:MAG: hypothetical protein ACOYNZ_14210, partial [Rhodoferax sp.]